MLKSSLKSGEGLSVFGSIIGCLYMLSTIIGGGSPDIPIDELLKHAQNATEVAEAYTPTSEWVQTASIGTVLTFIYKILAKFIDARTELKKDELAKN